jgi:hypothetical protein
METMNRVELKEVKYELGKAGWRQLRQMTQYLLSRTWDTNKKDRTWTRRLDKSLRLVRFAPSIITRSEVEVFCVSMPRFAYRLEFGREGESAGSFLNCRRLTTFQRQLVARVPHCWGERIPHRTTSHPKILGQVRHIHPKRLLSGVGGGDIVIADGLLQVPSRYDATNTRFIKTPLYHVYGESLRRTECGVPYVKTVAFGGGLCAQACCYMASALLHEDTQGVYGLGEITALASPAGLEELLIAGLEEPEMERYFSSVGLSARIQFCNPDKNECPFPSEHDADMDMALHGYVISEMPVLLFADRRRLRQPDWRKERPLDTKKQWDDPRETSVYEYNGFTYPTKDEDSESQVYHAVLVVGCERRDPVMEKRREDSESAGAGARAGRSSDSGTKKGREARDRLFFLHDPSGMPFMRATIGQLAQVGYHERGVGSDMRHPVLLPVTPDRVKMPLLCCGVPHEWDGTRGLIQLIRRWSNFGRVPAPGQFLLHHWQLDSAGTSKPVRGRKPKPFPGTSISQFFEESNTDKQESNTDKLRVKAAKFLHEDLVRAVVAKWGWRESRWVWIECLPNLVRIWDAEESPRRRAVAPDFLRATVKVNVNSRELEGDPPVPPGSTAASSEPVKGSSATGEGTTVAAGKPAPPDNLQKALLSSFTVRGAVAASALWPTAAPLVEFYACMYEDCKTFFPEARQYFFSGLDKRLRAWFGYHFGKPSLKGTPDAVRLLADRHRQKDDGADFARRLKEDVFPGRPLVGFATFMPEIMAHTQGLAAEAQEALQFLARVARHLSIPTRPFIIEMVAGGRTHGVWRAKILEGEFFAVNRLESLAALRLLLERLQPVAQFIRNQNDEQSVRVQLALELEPGPLFALGDKEGLLKLCLALQSFKDPALLDGFPSDTRHDVQQLRQVVNEDLYSVLGVNLDIPHWAWLARIELGWLKDPKIKPVRDRIVHAHISDHSHGHFCDNTLGVIHDEEEFRNWTNFLRDLIVAERPEGCPSYSGVITCEMEACKSMDFLKPSLEMLARL